MIELNYELLFGMDKQVHLISYFVIALASGVIITVVTPMGYARRNLSFTWFVLIMIGMIEEYRQFPIPDRSTEFLDMMANIVGVTGGLLIPFLITFFFRQQESVSRLWLFYMSAFIPMLAGLWMMNQRPFLWIRGDLAMNIESLFVFVSSFW